MSTGKLLASAHVDHAQVLHIGPEDACVKGVAQPPQESAGVVGPQVLDQVQAGCAGALHRVAIDDATVVGRWTVRAVGVSRSDLLDGRAGSVEFQRDGTFLGALFESLCALSLRVLAQHCEASIWHLRIDNGRHEVDFVLERDDGRVVAVEAKLSPNVSDRDVRHLRWLGDQIGDRLLDAVVLTTGERAYRRADGVAVVPLALLGP